MYKAAIMTLGEQISRLRAEKGLSQEKLANTLRVSRQSGSKWETNVSVPELDKLLKLSEVFGATLDKLVKGVPSGSNQAVASAEPAAKQFCPSACGIRRRQRNPENHRHYSAVLRGIDCIAVAFPDWKHRYMYFRDALPFVWASVLDGKAQSRVLVRLGMVLSRYAVSLSGYRNSVDSDFPNGRL